MTDGELLLTIVGAIATLLFLLSWIIPAANEKGLLHRPRRRSSSFPTFPEED